MFSFQVAVRFYMYLQFYIRIIMTEGCYILKLENKQKQSDNLYILLKIYLKN